MLRNVIYRKIMEKMGYRILVFFGFLLWVEVNVDSSCFFSRNVDLWEYINY